MYAPRRPAPGRVVERGRMSASDNGSGRLLGVLFPDDGPEDYEWLHIDDWLAARGLGGVSVRLDRPIADIDHTHEALFRTAGMDRLGPSARALAEAECEALMWACTSASFIGGLQWAHNQSKTLAEMTGLPASSTTLAVIAALCSLGAEEVDVLGAYPEPVTTAFVDCLGEAGIAVVAVESLGTPHGAASFRLDIRAETRRFRERHPDRAWSLLVPDTAIDTLDLLGDLEEIAGVRVITANQATLWQGLAMLDIPATVPGLGCLSDVRPRAAAE